MSGRKPMVIAGLVTLCVAASLPLHAVDTMRPFEIVRALPVSEPT